jgi:hypothetical protein
MVCPSAKAFLSGFLTQFASEWGIRMPIEREASASSTQTEKTFASSTQTEKTFASWSQFAKARLQPEPEAQATASKATARKWVW